VEEVKKMKSLSSLLVKKGNKGLLDDLEMA